MKPQKNGTVVFELKGESLAAALRLEAEIRKELETVKPRNTGLMRDIQKDWEKFYDGLLRRLAAEAPELLQATGLASPAVQVRQGKDSLPRAYREFPAIFSSPEKKPRYFMYAPVDYKGDHFTPRDGVRQNAKQERMLGSLLFADGWLGNAPLVSPKKVGVATPAGYAPAPDDGTGTTHTRRTFIAGGESLAAIEDYQRRDKEYHAACDRARKAINKIAEQDFPELLKSAPAGEELRAQATYRYGGYLDGRTEMLLSVRMEGKASIWNAGKTVPLSDNEAWTLKNSHGNEYVVEPRRDTQAGRALAAVLDAIPPTPHLSEYPVLLGDFAFKPSQIEAALGVNGVVPFVQELGGKKILVYNTEDDAKSGFTPKGATPLPVAAYNWLDADQGDRNMGIQPPPMPPEIAAILARPEAGGLGRKPAAPRF